MARLAPHVVIDDFLPAQLHDALLEHALGRESDFKRTLVKQSGVRYQGEDRQSWRFEDDLTDLRKPFRAAIREALPALLDQLGMARFEPSEIELELAAHRDGDYFRRHIDTFHGVDRIGEPSDRVLSAVYYFHTQPRGFSGGEFAIHPFGPGDPVLVEPCDNRLLALPAFAPHEVLPVRCPSDEFRCARFAINAWVHRARAAD